MCHDTIVCIMTRGRLGRWVPLRDSRDTAGRSATIRRRELRYARQRARERGNTALAVQRATRHDTTRHGRSNAQSVRSLAHRCVHCALYPILTQDTVSSHCLDHCSRGFQKKKLNQIKSKKIKFLLLCMI